MSDILASIRKIMAQDPPPGAPAAVKPQANGADGAPRAGVRLPTPEATREPALSEPARPAAPAPAPQPSAAATAPTPSAKSATGAAAAPSSRAPAPLAADEPVSLDEFLALAAPPKDVVTTPIFPAAPAEPAISAAPAAPAAGARAPASSGSVAPDWLFPRAQPADENKLDAVKEPAFGTASAGRPASATLGPSLAEAKPASSSPSTSKIDAPTPGAPMAGTVTTPTQAPLNAKDAGPVPARAAPPAPKMLGDLGSVVPARFDSRIEGPTRRIGEPMGDVNDRYSPVGMPTPAAPARVEMPRSIPAPDLEAPSEPEIPGADALRRLIAGVVPPSSLVPSAPPRAPAPNADDIQTEVVLPSRARAPDAVMIADPSGSPPAASAAKPYEPASAAKPYEPASAAKQAEATPAAKWLDAAPVTKPMDPAPAAKPPETSSAVKPKEAAPLAKPSDPASATKSMPMEPAPAVRSPAPEPAPKPTPVAAAPAAPTSVGGLPSGRTMDETVVELLRPLLRDWLDTNMPRLIEPALKAELEALRGTMSKDKKD